MKQNMKEKQLTEDEKLQKKFLTLLLNSESKKPHITQKQLNNVYENIYQFFSISKKKCDSEKKPCLFIIGELHPSTSGKSSLLVEVMFSLISHQFGIKNIFLESTDSTLISYKKQISLIQFAKKELLKTMKKHHSKKSIETSYYKEFLENFSNAVHLLNMPIIQKYKVQPLETKEFDPDQTDETMEKDMINSLMRFNQSGLAIMGAFHLKKLSENSLLKKQFLVFPINTIDFSQYKMYLDFIGESIKTRRHEYIFSEKVTQFVISGKLMEANIEKLLDMSNIAHQNFLDTMSIKNSSPLLSNSDQTIVPNQTINKATGNSILKKALPDKFSGFSELDSKCVAYPIETLPFTVLMQLGFWIASKWGICQKPSQDLNILFPHIDSIGSYTDERKSAELHFCKEGSSLEAALYTTLGDEYSKNTHKEKQDWRNFFINVVNKNVNDSVRESFTVAIKETDENLRTEYLKKIRKT